MPIARREAEIIWEGPLARGTGTLSSGSGALDQLAVTWASRTERPDGKTSPEELIAAAHASCFAMALVRALRGYGVLTRARLLDVCRATHWSDAGAKRALARAVSTGRIRQLGDDLYEIAKPPTRGEPDDSRAVS